MMVAAPFLLALVLPAARAPQQPEEAPGTLLVRADRIVVDPDTVLEDEALLLRDGKIALVGPEIPEEAERGVPAVSFEGTLVPGLVVAHAHLGRADDLAERATAVTPHLRAADAFDPFDETLALLARGGVTTVTLAPFSANTLAGRAAVAKTGERGQVVIPDSYLKAALVDEALDQDRFPTSRMGAVDLLRQRFLQASRGPALDEETRALRAVLDGRFPLAIHARSHGAIVEALDLFEELGLRPLLIGADEAKESAARIASLRGSVILEPLALADPLPRLELPAALEEAGVPFSFGVDPAPEISVDGGPRRREIAPGIYIMMSRSGPQQQIEVSAGHPDALRTSAALAVRHGASRRAALDAITRVPARQCGADGRVGTLRQGRDADFCVFGGDPLDLSAPLHAVFVGGRRVDRQGEVSTQ